MLRAAYRYEKDNFDKELSTTFYTGLSAGLTLQTKLTKSENANTVALDYAFKPTRIAGGVHTVGVRLNLNGKSK